MKILKIAFKNINSLQGEHEIDFQKEPFRLNHLFAITGPTGSGKTTILDVIVLALFNEIPRLGRISKSEIESKGAIVTRGQKEAYAKVTYSCVQGDFTSEWSISTARTGNLRDYEMFVSNATTGEYLVSKKSEVPTKNEELIGLKYDQFVKSVMLAQGAFAEFLRVPKKERSAILEKITGMDIYRKIGMRTYDKYKEVKNTIEDIEKEILNWQNELLEEETVSSLVEENSKSKDELSHLQKSEIEWLKKIEHKEKIKLENEKLDTWKQKGKHNESELQRFEESEGLALSKHKQLEPIQQSLLEWNRLRLNLQKLEEQADKIKLDLNRNEEQKNIFHEEISNLLKSSIPENTYETALATFEKDVLKLQNDLNSKIELGKALKNEIEADIRPIGLNLSKDYKDDRTKLISLKEEATQFFKKEKAIALDESSTFNDHLSRLKLKLEEYQQAKSDAREIKLLQGRIGEIKKDIVQLEQVISELPEKIEQSKASYKLSERELENLRLKLTNQQLLQKLETHRSKLTSGEPCPLCGALEHPYAHDLPETNENSLEGAIKEKQQETSKFSNQLNELKTTFNLKQKDLHKQKDVLLQLTKQEETILHRFENEYDLQLDTNWQQEIDNTKEKIELYQDAIKFNNQLSIAEIALPKLDNMLKVLEDSIRLRDELIRLYNGEKPVDKMVSELERKWQQIQTDFKLLKNRENDIKDDLDTIQKSIKPKTSEIDQHISNLEFNNIPSAFGALLDYETLQKLETQKEQLAHTKNEIRINIATLQKGVEDLLKSDVKEDLDQLKLDLLETQKRSKEVQKIIEEQTLVLRNQQKYKEKIQELKQKIKEENKVSKHWRILNDLIGDATGNKFNTFAQDLTLQQLLQLANKRLEMLSDRYLVANPDIDEDDSLVVIDKDMGGQRRSVKTLSGGETFVISLALALALSDLASYNVKIESLFIDEGFGTLDPETLDQTLNTLEQLQDEGSKMIGIISHVSSLKERITTQIQVKPNGRGFSTLEIVG